MVSDEPKRNDEQNVFRLSIRIILQECVPVNFKSIDSTGHLQERVPVNFKSYDSTGNLQERIPVNFKSYDSTGNLQERVPVNFKSNESTGKLQECLPVNFTRKGVLIKPTFIGGPVQIHRNVLLGN
jgi:hypothetical protein